MIGSELEGYRLESVLGVGAFGTAYVATKASETFVVKVLHSNALSETARKRFDREIRGLQKVSHPNVVRYVHHGEQDLGNGPVYFLVMPFAAGSSLHTLAGARPVWSEDEVLGLAGAVADALGAIHDAEIVHRDLKPANILIRPDGSPLLLDFGLVKLMDYSSITREGGPGTLRYMAPEQVYDDVDGRADLYALGVIMYELLTGTEIFEYTGDFFNYLIKLKTEVPEMPSHRNPSISPRIENQVMRLLNKEPHQRPTSARDLTAEFASVNAPEPRVPVHVEDTGVGPRFYLHMQHNEAGVVADVLKTGVTVNGIVYGAGQVHTNAGPINTARASKVPLTVDPETHRLARSDFSRTKGLVELPYSNDPMAPIKPADLVSTGDYQELVRGVVGFQDEHQASAVVAPYFHFSDMDNDWLKRNVKLVGETSQLMADHGDQRPLWAVISTDIETLCDEDAQTRLLNLYSRHGVATYWFLVNFDEMQANAAQLFNYTQTLLRFRSLKRAVIAGRVGTLGLGLCAMGVTGFSSGLTSLEKFSWSYYTDRAQVTGGQQRYYLREIMQNVSVETAGALLAGSHAGGFDCPCPGCVGSLPSRLSWGAARTHYLCTRHRQLTDQMRLAPGARLEQFRDSVVDAARLAERLQHDGYRVRSEHFQVWLRVMDELVQRGVVVAA